MNDINLTDVLPLRSPLWGAALCAFLAAGCGRESVQVYQVEKEPSANPHAASPHGMPPHGDMRARLPQMSYKLPSGWTEQPTSAMRAASFTIAGEGDQVADVGVIPLQGVTSRDLEMVNMWRSQVALPAVEAEGLGELTSQVAVGSSEGKFFDMASKEPLAGQKYPVRILAAIQDHKGTGWFFKMTGPDQLVTAQKAAFLEFLKSVELGEAAPVSPHGADASGAAHAAGVGAGNAPNPTWTVPGGWQEVPGGQFLAAKFNIPGEGGAQAAVNVSTSVGDGGGWGANVNRWRGQLGLSEMSVEELKEATSSMETMGGRAMMVSLAGTDAGTQQPAALVGVMVMPHSGQSWFYKLMGDPKTVASQKDAFAQFVKSVKY